MLVEQSLLKKMQQHNSKGPSTNIMSTLGFYIRNYVDGLGQVLIVSRTWTPW